MYAKTYENKKFLRNQPLHENDDKKYCTLLTVSFRRKLVQPQILLMLDTLKIQLL